MYLSLHQVSRLLNLKTTNYQQLFKKLEKFLPSLAFEIESVFDPQKANTNIVAGQITAIKKISASDHLFICTVKVHKNSLQIICGASNIFVGANVIIALPGAKLANGQTIEQCTMFNQLSQGMICSWHELGLSFKQDNGVAIIFGLWKLDCSVWKQLMLDCLILDISIPYSRTDCHSIYHIVSEIAAAMNYKIKPISRPKEANLIHKVNHVQFEFSSITVNQLISLKMKNLITKSPSLDFYREIYHALIVSKINPTANFWIDFQRYLVLYTGCACFISAADTKQIYPFLLWHDDKLGNLKSLNSSNLTLSFINFDYQSIRNYYNQKIKNRQLNLKYSPNIGQNYFFREQVSERLKMAMNYFCFISEKYQLCDVSNITNYQNKTIKPKLIKLDFTFFQKIAQPKPSFLNLKKFLSRVGIEYINCLNNNIFIFKIPSWRQDLQIDADLIDEYIRLSGTRKLSPVPFYCSTNKTSDFNTANKLQQIALTFIAKQFVEIHTYNLIPFENNNALNNFFNYQNLAKTKKNDHSSLVYVYRPNLLYSLMENLNKFSKNGAVTNFFEITNIETVDKKNIHIGFIVCKNFNFMNKSNLLHTNRVSLAIVNILNYFIFDLRSELIIENNSFLSIFNPFSNFSCKDPKTKNILAIGGLLDKSFLNNYRLIETAVGYIEINLTQLWNFKNLQPKTINLSHFQKISNDVTIEVSPTINYFEYFSNLNQKIFNTTLQVLSTKNFKINYFSQNLVIHNQKLKQTITINIYLAKNFHITSDKLDLLANQLLIATQSKEQNLAH